MSIITILFLLLLFIIIVVFLQHHHPRPRVLILPLAFTLLRCSLRSVARSSKDRSGLEQSRGWAERLKRVIRGATDKSYNDVIWIIQYNSRHFNTICI